MRWGGRMVGGICLAVLLWPTSGAAFATLARSPNLLRSGGRGLKLEASAGSAVGAQAFHNPGVIGFGDATDEVFATPDISALPAPIVGMAATPDGKGYWLAGADGSIYPFGDAGNYGSLANLNITAPIVGIAATPDGKGYWLVGIDGGIFAFGDAAYYGSMGAIPLNQPIVGMAATPDGKGYWMVAADGGLFTFGDAAFLGSMGSTPLNQPIVGMATTPDGKGYWMVAADGGLFTFGDAGYFGSTGANPPANSAAGMATTPDGKGYWIAGADGTIYPFGDAMSYGDLSQVAPTEPIAAIAPTPDGNGYWLLEPDAYTVAFTHPAAASDIVSIAASQIQGDPDPGYFCNPYGPCEEWCSLFTTWVWQQVGIDIPSLGFTGDVYTWAADNTEVLDPTATPAPGDVVLYGTGPDDSSTSFHVGIVAQVWPDGAIDTVDGDAGPGTLGYYSVVMNGPFLPAQSAVYNGMPIYGYAVP